MVIPVARNKITDNYRKKRPVLLDDQFSYRGNDEDEPLYIQDLIKSSGKVLIVISTGL